MKRLAKIALLCAFAAAAVATSFSAVAAGEAAPVRLAQDAVCTKCHDESETKPILAMYQTLHGVTADARTPSCQSCHGQSAGHLAGDKDGNGRPAPDIIFGSKHTPAGYQPSDPLAQTEACLTCHKSGLRTHWSGSQHQTNDVVCSNCHKVHAVNDPMLVKVLQPEVCFGCHKEQRAQTHQFSTHPLDAGKMACSDCHNPHGSAGPKLLAKNTVTETCLTCHAEKRGPFLWEHQPVNEDCTNCHTPHGSNISPLLKSRPPFMCDECHDGPHNSQAPYGTAVGGIQGGGALAGASPNSNAVGRACMNCHVMIHGSNSPTGAFLHH
jgi:DmsE family decaheme c-type cytochrome